MNKDYSIEAQEDGIAVMLNGETIGVVPWNMVMLHLKKLVEETNEG